jgi:hypothetical protein
VLVDLAARSGDQNVSVHACFQTHLAYNSGKQQEGKKMIRLLCSAIAFLLVTACAQQDKYVNEDQVNQIGPPEHPLPPHYHPPLTPPQPQAPPIEVRPADRQQGQHCAPDIAHPAPGDWAQSCLNHCYYNGCGDGDPEGALMGECKTGDKDLYGSSTAIWTQICWKKCPNGGRIRILNGTMMCG